MRKTNIIKVIVSSLLILGILVGYSLRTRPQNFEDIFVGTAGVPLTDNFETYTAAPTDLDGQGGWTKDITGGKFFVTTTNPNTGSNTVHAGNVANFHYYKAVDNILATGTEIYYTALASTPNTGDGYGVIFWPSGTPGTNPGTGYVWRVLLSPTSTSLYDIKIQTPTSGTTTVTTGISVANTYHKIQVDWTAASSNVTVTVDSGASASQTTASFSDIDYISVWESGDPTDSYYVDDFQGVASATPTPSIRRSRIMEESKIFKPEDLAYAQLEAILVN